MCCAVCTPLTSMMIALRTECEYLAAMATAPPNNLFDERAPSVPLRQRQFVAVQPFFVCLCAAAQESKPPNARNVTATVAPPMTPEKGGAGALSLFSVNSIV